MSYGHTSHGSQIVSGLGLMRGSSGSLYWYDASGSAGGLSLHDYTPSGDLGKPGPHDLGHADAHHAR